MLLRHAINANLVKVCVLAGLGDERIAKALMAMHEQPERDWTTEPLDALSFNHPSSPYCCALSGTKNAV